MYRLQKTKKSCIKKICPLPYIDGLFDQARGGKVLSKIHLKLGYHQIRIKDEYIHKTTIRTRYDHDEFMVEPFGLTNAPITCMCIMNSVFNKYLDKFVLEYIDEILIYSKSEQEHENHLSMVLQILRELQLYAKLIKCDVY